MALSLFLIDLFMFIVIIIKLKKTYLIRKKSSFCFAKNPTIVHFGGYYAPSSDNSPLIDILFVPMAYNYPGFDFVYFVHEQNTALFFHVTIMKECVKQVKENDKKASNDGSLRSSMKVSVI